jgi:ankyrin repeat protein
VAAAALDYENVLLVLLKNGADIDAQDKTYGTPLQAAAGQGHKTIVQGDREGKCVSSDWYEGNWGTLRRVAFFYA